MWSPIWKSTRT